MANVLDILKQPLTHEWRTPPRLFSVLNDEFAFTLDAAATDDNALVSNYYTEFDDGLWQSWSDTGWTWCNPPYGNQIGKWVKKAYDESQEGRHSVLLIPSRTDTSWWHRYVMHARDVRLVSGRVRFSGSSINAPFPSCVVVFAGHHDHPVFSAMDRFLDQE